jgi:predicted nucleic acid-binding protein
MAELLASFRTPPGHAFWQEELSLLDRELVKASRLLNSAHFTDSYLLTLARVHNGQLATLGQRMVTDVIDGPKALHLIR